MRALANELKSDLLGFTRELADMASPAVATLPVAASLATEKLAIALVEALNADPSVGRSARSAGSWAESSVVDSLAASWYVATVRQIPEEWRTRRCGSTSQRS